MRIYSTIIFLAALGFLTYNYDSLIIDAEIYPIIKAHFIPVKYNSEQSIDKFVQSQKGFADKQIIGIGEATHGTAEFREVFANLTKSLIKHKGFNVLYWAEKEYYESVALNQYVLGLNDSIPVSILLRNDSEHDRNLVSWIKTYNQTKSEKDKVWILCGDLYSVTGLARNILFLCKTYHITLSNTEYDVLYDLAFMPYGYNWQDKKYEYNYLINTLKAIEIKTKGIKNDGSLQQAILLNTFNVIQNDLKRIYSKDKLVRDTNMFEILAWAKALRENANIIIFAHNSHIEKGEGNIMTYENGRRLGKLINNKYKDQYYTLATEVENGFYNARVSKEPIEICTANNKIGNIIGKSTNDSSGFLAFNSSKEVFDFFSEKLKITYGVNNTENAYCSIHKNTSEAFDGLFWIKTSTPLVRANPFFNGITAYINPEKYHLKDSINISYEVQYKKYYGKDGYDDMPNLLFVFFDKQEQIVSYTGLPLNNGKGSYTVKIPNNVAKIGVQFGADNLHSFTLKNLKCNNVSVNLRTAYYTTFNYAVQRDSTQFQFKIKEAFVHEPGL
ncbi:erythromycin esterase family protein [Arcicella aquatica]|uniref:Erythromycin esterase family protein n=1 Tax=Arcicella aquatica TaxID=217141 RepID=A0ABU5QU29_9BACT|nr:erythromycin esterase family protein [Arcicella aquatica]MEA5260606.1 erythromycin esterase family protein [Arcicella aquatica]